MNGIIVHLLAWYWYILQHENSYRSNRSDDNSNIAPLIETINTQENMRFKQPRKQNISISGKTAISCFTF